LGGQSVTASTVLALAVPIGVAMTASFCFAPSVTGSVRRDDGNVADGGELSRHYGLRRALTLLQIISDFVAIAEGNTRFSMWMLIGGFTLNIVLDPILIFGFDLGVARARHLRPSCRSLPCSLPMPPISRDARAGPDRGSSRACPVAHPAAGSSPWACAIEGCEQHHASPYAIAQGARSPGSGADRRQHAIVVAAPKRS